MKSSASHWAVTFLSSDDVITLHDRVIAGSGGAPGMDATLKKECRPGRPHGAFGRVASFLNVREQAAEYRRAIRHNRPFEDGNKRTADAASRLFLEWNGGAHA